MRKKEYDIIILYEHYAREYDNALLLKCELEKRGYSVKIIHTMGMFSLFRIDSFLIIPACYSTIDVDFYRYRLNAPESKILNLQYEQVIATKDEWQMWFYMLKGEARNIYHSCWGESNYKRIGGAVFDKNHLRICGAMHLDFCRDDFIKFYKSKGQIGKEFGLDAEKKWLLYISSFSYASDIAASRLEDESIREFAELSVKSMKETLNILGQLLSQRKDLVVIYRNHPAETASIDLYMLEKKYRGRFFIIDKYNVKQWIAVSDAIVTWMSTAAVECYFQGKRSITLRPYEFPSNLEMELFKKENFVRDVRTLNRAIDEDIPNSLDEDYIKMNYDVSEEPSYRRVADYVENIISGEHESRSTKYARRFTINRIKHLVKKHVIAKAIIIRVYQFLYKRVGIRIKSLKTRELFHVEELEKAVNRDNDIEKIQTIRTIIG